MKKYVQGSKVDFTVQLATVTNGISKAFDLTGNVEITMTWKLGSSILTKNRVAATVGVIVLGAATDGKVKGTLLPADTLTQTKGTAGLLEIKVDFGSNVVKVFQIKNAFAVDEKASA